MIFVPDRLLGLDCKCILAFLASDIRNDEAGFALSRKTFSLILALFVGRLPGESHNTLGIESKIK
jgi:hypothetical protein